MKQGQDAYVPRKLRTRRVVVRGCLVLMILASVAVVGGFAWVKSYVSNTPAIEAHQPDQDKLADAKAKVDWLWAAIDNGRGGTVTFTEDEINAVLASESAMMRVSIAESTLRVMASIQLGDAEAKEFVNTNSRAVFGVVEGRVTIRLEDTKVEGKSLPGWLERELNEELSYELQCNRDAQRVGSIVVKGGKVHITIREK